MKTEEKKSPVRQDRDRHECTSWVVTPDLTGNNTMLLHKNRDADAVKLAFYRVRPEKGFSWMALSDAGHVSANMGLNEKGVAVAMNSGNPSDGTSENSGLYTPEMARVALEKSATAAEAVAELRALVEAKQYRHGKRGSIWFAADAHEAWIAENDARRFAAHRVAGGLGLRANGWHFPEMLPFSRLTPDILVKYGRREFAVRQFLFEGREDRVTVEKTAGASRIPVIPESPECCPVCGKRTNSAATVAIDCEFPESLSVMYTAFGPPRYTLYLPVPFLLKEIPEALTSGRFSDSVFARKETGAELPEEERDALEAKMNERHREAAGKAREALKQGKPGAPELLSQAFAENWKEACLYLDFK